MFMESRPRILLPLQFSDLNAVNNASVTARTVEECEEQTHGKDRQHHA